MASRVHILVTSIIDFTNLNAVVSHKVFSVRQEKRSVAILKTIIERQIIIIALAEERRAEDTILPLVSVRLFCNRLFSFSFLVMNIIHIILLIVQDRKIISPAAELLYTTFPAMPIIKAGPLA